MKTKTLKKNKVNVVTLGCSKNIFDSEVLMSQLKANDYEVEHENDESDAAVVIVNTCGFIDNAKQESIDTILNYVDAKQEGLLDKLYVTGCLSERYKDDLEKEIPEVDAYFGTRDLPRLLKTLRADYKHELVGERLLTTPSHYAYFKISEGCDRPCSFCAIPLMRGKHVSTPIEELVSRAKKLAAKGVKELLIIAQDSTYYGLDIYKKRNLPELLNKLSEVEGIDWIRLHYAFPTSFPLGILDEIAKNTKICNYLDMPLQHISTKLLKSMKRGITKDKTIELVDKIRNKCPDIALRTSIITGYPGETEEDHIELLNWIKSTKFERLGVFTYSHEENTSAHNLEDDVPDDVKRRRADEIMSVQMEISRKLNEEKVGEILKVLIDRKEGDFYYGRTEYDSPEVDNEVLVPVKNNYLRIGDFVEIKIVDADDYDLIGKPIDK